MMVILRNHRIHRQNYYFFIDLIVIDFISKFNYNSEFKYLRRFI